MSPGRAAANPYQDALRSFVAEVQAHVAVARERDAARAQVAAVRAVLDERENSGHRVYVQLAAIRAALDPTEGAT